MYNSENAVVVGKEVTAVGKEVLRPSLRTTEKAGRKPGYEARYSNIGGRIKYLRKRFSHSGISLQD